jgi:transcriptional activator of cad operon
VDELCAAGQSLRDERENREAADAYLTAFNLRPGENTFYWIENAVFQTSVTRVVPYLDNFLSSE